MRNCRVVVFLLAVVAMMLAVWQLGRPVGDDSDNVAPAGEPRLEVALKLRLKADAAESTGQQDRVLIPSLMMRVTNASDSDVVIDRRTIAHPVLIVSDGNGRILRSDRIGFVSSAAAPSLDLSSSVLRKNESLEIRIPASVYWLAEDGAWVLESLSERCVLRKPGPYSITARLNSLVSQAIRFDGRILYGKDLYDVTGLPVMGESVSAPLIVSIE